MACRTFRKRNSRTGQLGGQHMQKPEKILFFQFNDLALGFFGIRDLTEDQGRPDLYLAMGAMTLAIN